MTQHCLLTHPAWVLINRRHYLVVSLCVLFFSAPQLVPPKKDQPEDGKNPHCYLGGVYMGKLAPAPVSHWDDYLLSYHFFSSSTTPSSIEETYACATRFCLPRDRFIPKRAFVLHSHDTVARFRTGMKFLPRYSNRAELAQVYSFRHYIFWWYHVNEYRAIRGNRSELSSGRKSPRYHINTPLMCMAYRLNREYKMIK